MRLRGFPNSVKIGHEPGYVSKSKDGLPGLGAFSLRWRSAFGVTAHGAVHGAAHDAFMTLPVYSCTKEGEAPQLGSGPTPCRQSF